MGLNIARGIAKRKELVDSFAARIDEMALPLVLASQVKEMAERIVDESCVITAPEFPRIIANDSATMSEGGRGGAKTVKLGNLVLNPWKLLMTLPAQFASLAQQEKGVVAALITLGLLYSVGSELKQSIPEREATVLWAMWVTRDQSARVPADGLRAVVNSERHVYGRSPLSDVELADALGALTKLRCLEQKDRHWYLRESVEVQFR